ncbi:MFS transporter, FSR family, fosmidomycin resistance protein [Andreprevotia lacus DSM 23236]|uniref:MFS transporter, FSR family, fosmidomycin resistance protein n=1 Tax=Andreprevotia lacus DSM 23236 TaxID=1121001 RepID=A0A1W1WY10_9NEIS|nr:MFS transporter [Andreprevotia lacus]SMC16497.1 MFS transporter, FSR family, fosmidomycin resistance protein [Andreprevotia lacus DSM 23236]
MNQADSAALARGTAGTGFGVLGAISGAHFLNDMIQSLILAIYPLLKSNFALTFTQIGLITFTYQVTASLLQPLVGAYTDKHPQRYALPFGMACSLSGLLLLAFAPGFGWLLLAAALMGTGSSIFHPESSRVARLASGGRHGLAQSLFQVGGNAGSAMGPLLAAWIIIPHGQHSVALFALAALLGIVILWQIGSWYQRQHLSRPRAARAVVDNGLSRRQVGGAMLVLMALVFSKYFYLTSISSYFTFYLIQRYQLSVQAAQLHLFVFLAAVAAGTILGGPIGDRIGRKRVIWFSILGAAPFTLLLPHVGLEWIGVLTFVIGFILASAFSAILVYAQELMPGRVGMVSGLFFGFAFGMGGIGAGVLGHLADSHGIEYVYRLCAWLPLLGLLTALLPEMRKHRQA